MSGSDICIHGQPVDAYCRACESERAAPTTMSAAQVRQWMGERSAFPDTIYIAREDLVAIMAAIMAASDGYLRWGDALEDAQLIYDEMHKNKAAT